jgi:hypothetical protein
MASLEAAEVTPDAAGELVVSVGRKVNGTLKMYDAIVAGGRPVGLSAPAQKIGH